MENKEEGKGARVTQNFDSSGIPRGIPVYKKNFA